LTPLCDVNLDEDIIQRKPFNQTIFEKSIKLAQRLHAEKYAKNAIGKIQREVVVQKDFKLPNSSSTFRGNNTKQFEFMST